MAKTKNKPNKGLVKRVTVTGSGRIKMRRPGNRHLRSHKTAERIRGYRRPTLASEPDMMRLRRVLGLKRPQLRYAEKFAETASAEPSAEPVAEPVVRTTKPDPVPTASTGRTRQPRSSQGSRPRQPRSSEGSLPRKPRGSAPADER